METEPDPRRWVATKRHVAATVKGEVVILHLDDGVYYGLNAVGTRVWELVQSPRTTTDVVDALLAEFDVDRAPCTADVESLLDALAGKGLVSRVGAEP